MLRSKVNLNAIKETFINKSRTNIPLAITRAIYRKVFRRIPSTTVIVDGSGTTTYRPCPCGTLEDLGR